MEDLIRYQEAEQQEIARRKQVMLELMAETERLGHYTRTELLVGNGRLRVVVAAVSTAR